MFTYLTKRLSGFCAVRLVLAGLHLLLGTMGISSPSVGVGSGQKVSVCHRDGSHSYSSKLDDQGRDKKNVGSGPVQSSGPGYVQHEAVSTSAGSGSEKDSAQPEDPVRRLLRSMGIQYSSLERKVEVKGWVNMQRGPVEVFACAPGGKTHEAVVVLDCAPRGLHAGLLALGLKPGSPVQFGPKGETKPPSGDRVDVKVRWSDPEGKEHEARAEDWIWDEKRKKPMAHASWIFAGSYMQNEAGQEGPGSYAADMVKSLVTTYYDPTTILENPALDANDDTVYSANERAVPAVKTPIVVTFSPAKN